jgi:hypothetical protein
LGEGGVELGVTTVRREMFALAEGEDGVFQRAGAVEAPAVLGDGLGEVGFDGAFGVEVFAEGIAVLRERFLVFGSGRFAPPT